MKKVAAALTGLVALVLASGLLLFHYWGGNAADKEPSSAEYKAKKQRPSGAGGVQIEQLAKQKTAAARDKLVQLYVAWAGKPDFDDERRWIVSEIIRNEEPSMAINLIVTAVSKDPIPLEDDEMLSTVARDMVGVWKNEWFVSNGRDLLRLTENVKAKALLAESLSWRVDSPPSDLPSVELQRHQLASDLIQTYQHTSEKDLKRRVLQNVEMVASADVAEILANPANAANSKLAKRLEQNLQDSAQQARSSQ
jgi:hypothetical protein